MTSADAGDGDDRLRHMPATATVTAAIDMAMAEIGAPVLKWTLRATAVLAIAAALAAPVAVPAPEAAAATDLPAATAVASLAAPAASTHPSPAPR